MSFIQLSYCMATSWHLVTGGGFYLARLQLWWCPVIGGGEKGKRLVIFMVSITSSEFMYSSYLLSFSSLPSPHNVYHEGQDIGGGGQLGFWRREIIVRRRDSKRSEVETFSS